MTIYGLVSWLRRYASVHVSSLLRKHNIVHLQWKSVFPAFFPVFTPCCCSGKLILGNY